ILNSCQSDMNINPARISLGESANFNSLYLDAPTPRQQSIQDSIELGSRSPQSRIRLSIGDPESQFLSPIAASPRMSKFMNFSLEAPQSPERRPSAATTDRNTPPRDSEAS